MCMDSDVITTSHFFISSSMLTSRVGNLFKLIKGINYLLPLDFHYLIKYPDSRFSNLCIREGEGEIRGTCRGNL